MGLPISPVAHGPSRRTDLGEEAGVGPVWRGAAQCPDAVPSVETKAIGRLLSWAIFPVVGSRRSMSSPG